MKVTSLIIFVFIRKIPPKTKEIGKCNSAAAMIWGLIRPELLRFNFAKAFDGVDHKIILIKLNAHGISAKLQSWLTNYLSDLVRGGVLEVASSPLGCPSKKKT